MEYRRHHLETIGEDGLPRLVRSATAAVNRP